MRPLGPLLLASLASALLLSGAAAADPVRVDVGPTPLCDLVPGTFYPCAAAWAEADGEGLQDCATGQAACGTFSCTLDFPPSRCGNAWLGFGLAFRR